MATNVILDCEDEFEENDSGSSFSSTSSFEDGDECSPAEESCEVIGFNFEPSTDEESDEEDPTQDIRRLLSTDWCKCDHCVPMGTIKESRCCQEIDHPKFAELLAGMCVVFTCPSEAGGIP
ncbi:hypothetical protein V1264_022190 [Littorina saxatilis]|uniref:Uncharacterized protein n=1 Tax=Littorina saxatilis TaxID=31220 RepID=A0AAN9AK39_9CAEN